MSEAAHVNESSINQPVGQLIKGGLDYFDHLLSLLNPMGCFQPISHRTGVNIGLKGGSLLQIESVKDFL